MHLIVEIQGYREKDISEKRDAMEHHWIPRVNRLGTCGHRAFAELANIYTMQGDSRVLIESHLHEMVTSFLPREKLEAIKQLTQVGGSSPDAKHIPRCYSENLTTKHRWTGAP